MDKTVKHGDGLAEIGQREAPGYRHNPRAADWIWEMERP
jgi:hypothetical protein